MTKPEEIRAQFLVMSAVEAARDEGAARLSITNLWGNMLCRYMTFDSYFDAVESLWKAKAIGLKDGQIVIKRRGK